MRILFSTLLACASTVLVAQETFHGAHWIRDPRFTGQPVLDVFDVHQKNSKEAKLKNVHSYFRKAFTLEALPQNAVLRFTADDLAKVNINGTFVIQGPEPGYPFAHPYYDVDVTQYLRIGENVLSAHVYYHGLATRAFNSADNRNGLIARLALTMPDGMKRTVATDTTWRCFASQVFSSDRVFGYQTQFNENMNLSLEPAKWREPGFDDAAWTIPLDGFQDHAFVPAMAAPLQHTRAVPVVSEQTATNRWFVDMGTEVVGHTRVRIKGQSGQAVTVWHGEELSAPKTVRHNMRSNCDYVDTITLTGGDDLIEFFDYRAFRYIELINAPGTPEVWVDVRHYPFDGSASKFRSSNDVLNRIWDISKRGVQMGSQSVFVDCPQREKGQYTGDTYMTVLSQLLLTGDPALTRKAIVNFHQSQRFNPGMLCVAPGGFWQELAEWSLLWPQMVTDYYQMTGDRDLVKELVEAGAFDLLMAYFSKLEREDGLLAGVDRQKWVLVDWPANLRGGYDYEKTKNGVNTVINAFYYRALRNTADMMRVAGRSDTAYMAKADRLRETFNAVLLDTASGLYIDGLYEDGTRSPQRSLHASGFPLYFELVPDIHRAAVIDLIRKQRLNCGIYGAPYFIAALFQNNQAELAYDLLTCADIRSWGQMLKEDATTVFEAWGKDQKWNTSLCQPAAGLPVWLIIKHMMGLSPEEPGFKKLRVEPRFPHALNSAEITFPTVSGTITARYKQGEGYFITVPDAIDLCFQATEGIPIKVVPAKQAK